MKRTGLDWSGDPGDVRKRGSSLRLVIVAVSIEESDVNLVHEVLCSVRAEHRLPEESVFKHSHVRAEVRASFFEAIAGCSIQACANAINKHDLPSEYVRRTSGNDRIIDGIAHLILAMPDESIEQGTLLIDLDKRENALVRSIRKRISDDLWNSDRTVFQRVKGLPDHRPEAALVQVADMLAGALGSDAWLAENCPRRLEKKIKLVGA